MSKIKSIEEVSGKAIATLATSRKAIVKVRSIQIGVMSEESILNEDSSVQLNMCLYHLDDNGNEILESAESTSEKKINLKLSDFVGANEFIRANETLFVDKLVNPRVVTNPLTKVTNEL